MTDLIMIRNDGGRIHINDRLETEAFDEKLINNIKEPVTGLSFHEVSIYLYQKFIEKFYKPAFISPATRDCKIKYSQFVSYVADLVFISRYDFPVYCEIGNFTFSKFYKIYVKNRYFIWLPKLKGIREDFLINYNLNKLRDVTCFCWDLKAGYSYQFGKALDQLLMKKRLRIRYLGTTKKRSKIKHME